MSTNDQPEKSPPPTRTCVEPPPLVRSTPEELAALPEQFEPTPDELATFWAAQSLATDVADYFGLPFEDVWECFCEAPGAYLGLLRSVPGQVAFAESAVDCLAPDHPRRGTFRRTITLQ